MQAELYSWGGGEEVTGSKHFLRIKDQTVMVDCGAFQGRRAEADEKNRAWPFEADKVNAAVLTHAHYDHCGLVPLLPKKGFTGNIYCTPATRDLASLVMMDSAHIQAKDYEFLRKRFRKRGDVFDKEPLYDDNDAARVLDHFVTVSYRRPIVIADGIRATFYDAGHILGSSLVVLDIERNGQKMRVGFAGDLGRKGLPILRDPETIPDVDYLVMESTYGNRTHQPIESAADQLAEVINRTAARGGKVIIPAFAIERTQELIYFLHVLRNEKRIPRLPMYVDSPMATNATSIFRVHQECYDNETRQAFLDVHKNPFGFDDLRYVSSTQESKSLNGKSEPMIIIASSGMCEAGRILHHLMNNIGDARNTVVVVGYMAQNTLGRRILERQPQVRIFGDMHELKAEVAVLDTFSAHADYNDVLEYVGRLDYGRLKQIFLVHGEQDAREALAARLGDEGHAATLIEYGRSFQLQT